MYQLGILSSTITSISDKQQAFEKINCQVEIFGELPSNEKLCTYDGILIEEIGEGDISQTFSIILQIKQQTNAYIWVLSENSTLINRQIYLQLGVDGNFYRESFPVEVIFYLKNFLERQKALKEVLGGKHRSYQTTKQKNQLELNPVNHSLLVPIEDGDIVEIGLTKLEYRIIELLYSHPGAAFSYEELYEKLWHTSYTQENYRVANVIFHIREKLEQHGVDSSFIKTVRSKGYMLKLEKVKKVA
ncbi:winged helix-turn-helix domain-containing protein [Enterococcus crotali]|uniref:winged helix-turn-helix domain-containing protein n=1 Tax=Enterococcus crotali TaxID=1453587 RepID=UPI00046FC549|nr:winged helix-turn-helix domain-containing protein [Enterococcus crotali]